MRKYRINKEEMTIESFMSPSNTSYPASMGVYGSFEAAQQSLIDIQLKKIKKLRQQIQHEQAIMDRIDKMQCPKVGE